MKELAQISMAAWLLVVIGSFAIMAWRPLTIRMYPAQMRRAALYGVAGALGEVVTLWLGGFWS